MNQISQLIVNPFCLQPHRHVAGLEASFALTASNMNMQVQSAHSLIDWVINGINYCLNIN